MVGDWLVNNETCDYLKVTKVIDNTYKILNQKGEQFYIQKGVAEDNCHKFTINDANDGDVLAAHECYVIFKEIDGLNIKCYCTYHYMGFNPSFHVDTLQNKNAFHPATKEQHDLLFQEMRKKGYKWDAKKKVLNKSQRMISAEACEAGIKYCIENLI